MSWWENFRTSSLEKKIIINIANWTRGKVMSYTKSNTTTIVFLIKVTNGRILSFNRFSNRNMNIIWNTSPSVFCPPVHAGVRVTHYVWNAYCTISAIPASPQPGWVHSQPACKDGEQTGKAHLEISWRNEIEFIWVRVWYLTLHDTLQYEPERARRKWRRRTVW